MVEVTIIPGPGFRTGPGNPTGHLPRSPGTTSGSLWCCSRDIKVNLMLLRGAHRAGEAASRGTGWTS